MSGFIRSISPKFTILIVINLCTVQTTLALSPGSTDHVEYIIESDTTEGADSPTDKPYVAIQIMGGGA